MKKALRLKLARLLRDAVADARKLEKTPGFELDMDHFCRPRDTGCLVCLGGAYAILHLKQRVTQVHMWSVHAQLMSSAVDQLRLGCVLGAAEYLSPGADHFPDRQTRRAARIIEESSRHRLSLGRASWSAYLKAARVLES
jgi:hypothetical protein